MLFASTVTCLTLPSGFVLIGINVKLVGGVTCMSEGAVTGAVTGTVTEAACCTVVFG